MTTLDNLAPVGEHKADFSHIYVAPDPRPYFDVLGAKEYQIPQNAMPVVRAALAASAPAGAPRKVLDLCCSYGINAALLRYDVELEELRARYTDPAAASLSPAKLARADESFYASRLKHPEIEVVGLDASAPAIEYACQVGLLRDGWAENLEDNDPSPELAKGLSDLDMLVCTGGVGYVGAPTFRRILDGVSDLENFWVISFVLRMFDYSEVIEVLDAAGLVTEQLPGVTFRQRRFADQSEQDAAMEGVRAQGLEPEGLESRGWFHAECFVTRPAKAADQPLPKLLEGFLRI